MYNIEFYTNKTGQSELLDFLESLRVKSINGNKDARIQFDQIVYCVTLLKQNGPALKTNKKVTKHIQGDLWELRPGRNRVFYFFYDGAGTYVLLHHFLKKSQRTPSKEIKKAMKEMNDYLARKGADQS